MSRGARVAVLVSALISLFTVLSTASEAVTWHSLGDTSFTATTGPSTLSSTGVDFTCPSGTAVGTVAAAPFIGVTWPAFHGTITRTGCRLIGQDSSMDCSYTLTAQGHSGGVIGGVTNGTLDVTCSVYIVGTKFCHVHGSVSATYTNPTIMPSIHGTLATFTGGDLFITRSSPFPTSPCPLGNFDRGHLSPQSFVTNGLGPILTRTA